MCIKKKKKNIKQLPIYLTFQNLFFKVAEAFRRADPSDGVVKKWFFS